MKLPDKKESSSTTDFEIMIMSEQKDDDTIIITSAEELSKKVLMRALSSYDAKNEKYSAYLKDGTPSSDTLTPEFIDDLSINIQNDISKVMRLNAIIRQLINKNDIVGKTVESIYTNINTDVKHEYIHIEDSRNKRKKLMEVKSFIHNFDDQIKLKQLVRNSIVTGYTEGTWISYLRHDGNNKYVADYYPLGVCRISEYNRNGEPLVEFDIQELRSRLQKIYKKTKKNKPLYFSNMEEEVKANYPCEVYEAFIAKEKFAKLDPRYTGVIRINNLNRPYGVSPILRALKDLSMIDTFSNTDRINSKAKGKKIIHQKLRKEVMGENCNKAGLEEMAYAHDNLMMAWQQPTVLVTTPPTVESILYVEPKVEMTSKDTQNIYRSRALSTLGVSFLMDSGSQSVSTASISVTQLMRTINTISEQLEDVLKKWYKQVLIDNGYPVEYCPDTEVIDSEELENSLKLEMATFLYSTLNASYETSYAMIGLSAKDEAEKRRIENESGYDEIFAPHSTAYTKSGNDGNSGGRPPSDDDTTEGKQNYDNEYNKNARGK